MLLALSIVSPNGSRIASGHKRLEIRSWQPTHWPLRNLLIVQNRLFLRGDDESDPDGMAVAVVDVDDVHAWQRSECAAACWTHWEPGLWAWQMTRVRPIAGAFPLTARRKLYDAPVNHALRECLASLRE